jgi:Uncharacterized conserved domain (SAYSvFN)
VIPHQRSQPLSASASATSRNTLDTSDDPENLLSPPQGSPQFYHHFLHTLHYTYHVPDYLVALIACGRWWFWPAMLTWLLLLPVAKSLDLAPVYIIVSIISVIFYNLGTRKPHEASAYTVFNNF